MEDIEKSSIDSFESKKFNKKHFIFLLIGLLFTLSLLGIAQYSAAQNTKKAQNSFTLATKLFNESNIKEAKKNIDDALALKPNNPEYRKLISRIENAEKSLESLSNAEQLIQNGMLQEALEILNSAKSPDLGIDVKSSLLIQKITPMILAENQIQIKKYLSSKQFSDAKEKLNSLIALYAGNKDVLDELMRDYNLISELEKKQSQQALSKLSKRYDKFQDITWYSSPNSPRYRNYNAFYIYFGSSDNSKLPLRLVVQYESDDWLFIESAAVNVDGENYSISGDWERDHDSRIWEWIDETLDDREMIEAIIKSKSAVIRFEGNQYYNTRTISASQKQSMRDVLLAYDGLRS
jgi:tetratricopeptide (TPR) repeat protein